MPQLLATLLAGFAPALAAQSVALHEDFNQAVPPAGWSQVRHNPLALGWLPSLDGRAWHQDEGSLIGACDDELISPALDLSGYAQVYAHFACELNFAKYLANHPASVGDGETDFYLRVAGGPWTEVWTETRTLRSTDVLTVDLTPYAAGLAGVEFAFRYYGTFAHETWVDWVQVDDDPAPPPPPPPPPVAWTVNLPGSFLPLQSGGTIAEDFEAWAGVPPPHMALTAVAAATGLPDPDAWCTIAGGSYPAANGLRCLEMGVRPGSGNFHYARNALVLGLDGSGSAGARELRFQALNFGEELQDFDGIWLSGDGQSWQRALPGWTGLPAAWTARTVDLRAYRGLTDGPFFLMFAQEDNFPYASTDGLGVDLLEIDADAPTTPILTRTGPCPGVVRLDLSGLTPNGAAIVLYGLAGSYTQRFASQPCLGLTIAIQWPAVGGILTADAAGAASIQFFAPVLLCGLTVQAVDLSPCAPSNPVVL